MNEDDSALIYPSIGTARDVAGVWLGMLGIPDRRPPDQSTPPYLDSRQVRIHKNLTLVAPNVSEFFLEACEQMAQAVPKKSATNQVAHLLREIESALRNINLTLIPNPKMPKGSSSKRHSAEVDLIIGHLQWTEDNEAAITWRRLADPDSDYALYKWAHRDALGPTRPINAEFLTIWSDVLNLLDQASADLKKSFARYFALMDELLHTKRPGEPELKRLRNDIPNNEATSKYFFDHLEDNAWLPFLVRGGFFRLPPEGHVDENQIRFPAWPQSRSLVRLVSGESNSELVQNLLIEIGRTSNPRVHEDILDVCMNLPITVARNFASVAREWLDLPFHTAMGYVRGDERPLRYPLKLAGFAAKLATEGEDREAIVLAEALLEVEPDPEDGIASRIDGDFYGHILERVLPALLKADPVATIRMLSNVLSTILQILTSFAEEDLFLDEYLDSQEDSESRDRQEQYDLAYYLGSLAHSSRLTNATVVRPPSDLSPLWYHAVEDVPEAVSPIDQDFAIARLLTFTLRQACQFAAGNKAVPIIVLVEQLGARDWSIFTRMALDLVRLSGTDDRAVLADQLLNKKRFHWQEVRHEYALLLRQEFPKLSVEEQSVLYGWIADGPDASSYRRVVKSIMGTRVSKADEKRFLRRWQCGRLLPIREHLSGHWKIVYERSSAELTTEHLAFLAYGTGSPGTLDRDFMQQRAEDAGEAIRRLSRELLQLDMRDLLYLLRRLPRSNPAGFERRLYRQALRVAAGTNAETFARHSELFVGLDGDLVKAILAGLIGAVKAGKPFSWTGLLELSRWASVALANDRANEEIYEYEFADESITSATLAVVGELLYLGMVSGHIPIQERKTVSSILTRLARNRHSDPMSSFDEPPWDMWWLHQKSRQSVQGWATHAWVAYIAWLVKARTADVKEESASVTLNEIPEARDIIEELISTSTERRPEIRAALGSHFESLYLVDPEWARTNASKLFGLDPSPTLALAALTGHLQRFRWHPGLYEIMSRYYCQALESLDLLSAESARRLAEDIMYFVLLGYTSIEDEGPAKKLFDEAPGGLRADALRKLHALFKPREEGQSHLDDLASKTKRIWDSRLRVAGGKEGLEQELRAFGSLASINFAWQMLGPDWLLARLQAILKRVPTIDESVGIVSALHSLVEKDGVRGPQVIRIVEQFISDPVERLRLGNSRPLMDLLTLAMKSSEEVVRVAASRMANELVADGYVAMREVLKNANGKS